MNIQDTLDLFLPRACAWAEQQEQRILTEGVPLTEAEMADAAHVGVRHPERARVLRLEEVPAPEDPSLLAAANDFGLFLFHTAGMALGYGIFLRNDLSNNRVTLAHELTHTGQYERMGGIRPFLQQYLAECLAVGYSECSFEREAIMATKALR